MEKCIFSKRLNYYLEDELSAAESVIISNHLKDCSICQNVLAELQKEDIIITDFLKDYKELPISVNLRNSMLLSTKKIHPKSRYFKKFTDFSIAASLIISFSLGVLITQSILKTNSEINFSTESLADISDIDSYLGE